MYCFWGTLLCHIMLFFTSIWDEMTIHNLVMYLYHKIFCYVHAHTHEMRFRESMGKKKDICLSTYHHFSCVCLLQDSHRKKAKYQFRFIVVVYVAFACILKHPSSHSNTYIRFFSHANVNELSRCPLFF